MFNPFDKKIKTVYGPYPALEKGRNMMAFTFWDGRKTTMSYARWKMIQHLERKLLQEEHVDHINEDCTDDRLVNLQILSQLENNRKSNLGKESPLKGIEKGWNHGTMYGWMKKKCQCDDCQDAKEEFNLKRGEKRRAEGKEIRGPRGPYNMGPKKHGTVSKYKEGCGCDICRDANADRQQEYRNRKKKSLNS